MSSQPHTTRPGFTLVELAIVLVIIGVTTAVSVPRIGRLVANERARRATAEISTFFEYAFSVARRSSKPLTVQYVAATGVLKLTDRATGNPIRQMPLKANSEYQFQDVGFTPSGAVVVYPNGMSSSAMALTVGMSSGISTTITASRVGQVRTQ